MVDKNRELGDFKELSKIRKQQCVNEFKLFFIALANMDKWDNLF